MKRYILPFVIVVLAFFAMNKMSGMKKKQKRRPPAEVQQIVRVKSVLFKKIKPNILSSGRIKSANIVNLVPEVSGKILNESFKLRTGQSFNKGQILIKIDNRDALYALKISLADLQNAVASVLPELKSDIPQSYDKWMEFFSQLSGIDLPNFPKINSKKEQLYVNRHNITKMYYTAKNKKLALIKHIIVAPFTGSVTKSNVYPYDMVKAGIGIATIEATDVMEIECDVSENSAQFIKIGTRVKIFCEDTSKFVVGKVVRVGEYINEHLQTVPIFIRFKQYDIDCFRSGYYANLEIEGLELNHAVVLPLKSVHGNKVYLVNNGKLSEKKINIAYSDLNLVYVTGGIKNGDNIIVDPVQNAIIGMPIQIQHNTNRIVKKKNGFGNGNKNSSKRGRK